MENILEIPPKGDLNISAVTIAEMGWRTGDKILLQRTEDQILLLPLAMSAEAGAKRLQGTVADLQGHSFKEHDTGEAHTIKTPEDQTPV